MVKMLADGACHSGEAIAACLGVSRAAVWKQVQGLPSWGLEVSGSAGRGYQLGSSIELLDAQALDSWLEPATRTALARLDLFPQLDSTNAYLLEQPLPAPGKLALALTEFQTAGRGRRGRSWSTPFGGGVMLSIGWQFERPPQTLAALSLATGVAARAALATVDVHAIGLKWPNDLVWQDGKLGGILVEISGDAQGPCYVVIGIGINVFLSAATRAAIEHDWGRGPVDLTEVGAGQPPSRNRLTAALVNHVYQLLTQYEAVGFGGYQDSWAQADALVGQMVIAAAPQGQVIGRAAGVDADGALLLVTAAGTHRITSGEVRLRPPP